MNITIEISFNDIASNTCVGGVFKAKQKPTSVPNIVDMRNLPLHPDGLVAGTIWNDGGVLKIVTNRN